MAIRMMVSEEYALAALAAGATNIEVVTDYPGHEAGRVSHAYYAIGDRPACPHDKDPAFAMKKGPGCNAGCHTFSPLYMETTHKGLVLSTGEYNGYDDSDFFAVVWNPVTGTTSRVEYATTRGWTYPNSAVVDATDEVKAAYAAYCEKARKEYAAKKAAEEAAKPAKGKTLKVVKGRKVPVGTTGVCIWIGAGHYGTRVGIKDASGDVHWTAVTNVVVA